MTELQQKKKIVKFISNDQSLIFYHVQTEILIFCSNLKSYSRNSLCKLRIWLPWRLYVYLVAQVCPTLRSHGLQLTWILCPWDFLGKNIGVGSHSLPQGTFPIQGYNLGLLHCRWILYYMSHQGSPYYTIYYTIYIYGLCSIYIYIYIHTYTYIKYYIIYQRVY